MSSPISRRSILSMPCHGLVQVEHLGGDGLLAGKGQQLPGEVGGALGGLADLLQVGMERLRRVHLLQGQLRVAEDHRQHVVEVVGHAAGQPAHRFHLLGLAQLRLQLLPLRLGPLALGDVPQKCHQSPAFDGWYWTLTSTSLMLPSLPRCRDSKRSSPSAMIFWMRAATPSAVSRTRRS